MKKLFYLLIFMFISVFFIGLDKVYATTCVYGIKTKDNNWIKQITIDVADWDNYTVVMSESPIFNGPNDYSPLTEKKDGEYKYYVTSYTNNLQITSKIKLYVALYPNSTVYELLNKECPAVLQYKMDFQAGGLFQNPASYDRVYALYNDDLNSSTATGADKFIKRFRGLNVTLSSGEYIEKKHKDEDVDSLRDKYNCLTYSSSIKVLQKAKDKFGTCDNNSDFTYEYDRLYSLCEAFRSTSTYASDDDDSISAKSCMTACSNLKDDVAEICNRKYSDVKCGSLGQKVIKWMYKIIRMFRYSVPVILIILSVLDYIKAIGNDSDDEMKKATSKFFQRLIVAAIIFTIPFILEFILKIFHLPGLDNKNPFCAN